MHRNIHRSSARHLRKGMFAAILAACAWAGNAQAEQRNPFDYIGESHNLYLECLMLNGGDSGPSALARVVSECGFEPQTDPKQFVADYSDVVDDDPTLSIVERMRPYRDRYDDYQFSFFERLDAILRSAESPEDARRALAMLEAEAITKLGTRTTQEQSIFAALSTARYSLEYWVVAWGETAQTSGDMGALRLKWWVKVLAVVGADLLGAAGGTLIGGPAVGGAVGAASSTGAATVLKDL